MPKPKKSLVLPRKQKAKVRGHPFKKGHKRPGPGRPPMAKEEKEFRARVRKVKRLTREEFVLSMHKYLEMPLTELKKIFEADASKGDTPTSSKDMIVIGAVVAAIERGDLGRLSWFMDQMFGPRPTTLELTSPDGSMTPRTAEVKIIIPSNGRESKDK